MSVDQTYDKKKEWSWLLILAATTTTLGWSLPAGFNIGVVNTPEAIIKEFCNASIISRYDIVLSELQFDVVWSAVVSIFIVGGVIGSLYGGWVADTWGRKGGIIVSGVLGIVSAICFAVCKAANSVELLLIARFLVGISAGLTTTIIPMYLTELSPLNLRGATGVLCPLGITIGVLLSQVLGLEFILGTRDFWNYLLSLYGLLIILFFFALPFLPESPKYLFVVRGQEEKAIKELVRLQGCSKEGLEHEIELLRREQRSEIDCGGKMSMGVVLKDPRLRLPIILVCSLQAGQQLSGINAVFYYSVSIFKSAGLSQVNAQYGSLGAGIINLGVALISVYTMNRFGRRRLILFSCVGATLCLTLLTVSISFTESESIHWMAFLSVAAVLFYVFLYGLGLGPIPYFIGSELFELAPRPSAMALGSMANWAGNFVVAMTFPSLQNLIQQFSFIIFIAVVILLYTLLLFYFPETRNIDQKDIAEMLKDGFHSKLRNDNCQKRNSPVASCL